jgi:hypothetical protein
VTLVLGGEKNTLRKEVTLPSERLVVAATREIVRAMPLPPVGSRTAEQVATRMKAMQLALLEPRDELLRSAERTGHDDDERWIETYERAIAA